MSETSVPAFVNRAAGSARAGLEVLKKDPRITIRDVEPSALASAVASEVERGASTIVVAGGDGTISTAAAGLIGSRAALCIVPAGTLNHIAGRLGVPEDPAEALELAFLGRRTGMDVGRVNGRLFLNTCVIGLYVDFARFRNRLQGRIGRWPAIAVSAARSLLQLRDRTVEIEINGSRRIHRTVFVYTAVGERELEAPMMGQIKNGGRRGLHIVVPQPGSATRLPLTVLRMAAHGVRPWPRTEEPECFVVDACRLSLGSGPTHVALDGEIVEATQPLSFTLERDALQICSAD